MSDDFKELKDEEKENLNAQTGPDQEKSRSGSPTARDNNSWIAGVVIIIVGVIFLISNISGFHLDNWWALFILIPGVMTFATAWRVRKEDGRWTRQARSSLFGGLGITLIAIIFLFNLDLGEMWPLFLILGGVAMLLGELFDA
jgi:uncharacterized membrane protein HdeD (DUF308 family)